MLLPRAGHPAGERMQTVELMISKTPNRPATNQQHLAECIDLCVDCELACASCADACLGEQELTMLRKCIRANLDCADVCNITARLLSRQFEAEPGVMVAQLEACARACVACAAE